MHNSFSLLSSENERSNLVLSPADLPVNQCFISSENFTSGAMVEQSQHRVNISVQETSGGDALLCVFGKWLYTLTLTL